MAELSAAIVQWFPKMRRCFCVGSDVLHVPSHRLVFAPFQRFNVNSSSNMNEETRDSGHELDGAHVLTREPVSHELAEHQQMQPLGEELAEFVAAYNASISSEGLPLSRWRTF